MAAIRDIRALFDRLVARPAGPSTWLILGGMVMGVVTGHPGLAWCQAEPPRSAVEVAVSGVRDAAGHIRVALCTRETFPGTDCPIHAASPAQAGTTTVRINGVPAGTYALEVFHDDDDSGRMEFSLLGVPKKGMGFSGTKLPLFGPPDFADAAVTIGLSGARIVARLRYY